MRKVLLILCLALLFPEFGHSQAASTGACSALANEASGGDANIVITLPTHLAGDLVYIVTSNHADNTVSSVTGSTTFSLVTTFAFDFTFEGWLYYSRTASAADGTVTVTFGSATGDRFGWACLIRGAKASGDPIEAISTFTGLTTDPDTITAITSVSANTLVCVAAMDSDTAISAMAYSALTSPTTITVVDYEESETGANQSYGFACATKPAAGSTGTISVDFTGTLNLAYGVAFAVTASTGSGIYRYYRSELEPSTPVEATPPVIEAWRDQIRPMQGLEAVALTKLGRLDEALAIHRELALRADTAYEACQAWNNVGAVLWDKKDYDGAVKAFNIAALADHGYFWAYDALLNSIHRRHFYNRSAPITSSATDLAETTYGFFGQVYTAGKFAFLDGRFALAARYLWWAIPLAENQSKFAQIATHLYLAESLAALGRTEAARYHVREAMRRDPTFEPSVAAEARIGLRNL